MDPAENVIDRENSQCNLGKVNSHCEGKDVFTTLSTECSELSEILEKGDNNFMKHLIKIEPGGSNSENAVEPGEGNSKNEEEQIGGNSRNKLNGLSSANLNTSYIAVKKFEDSGTRPLAIVPNLYQVWKQRDDLFGIGAKIFKNKKIIQNTMKEGKKSFTGQVKICKNVKKSEKSMKIESDQNRKMENMKIKVEIKSEDNDGNLVKEEETATPKRKRVFSKVTCEICNQTMVKYSYHKHVQMKHSSERPYKCSTCGKGFKIKYHLTQHMATHTAKNYECSICFKKFRRLYDMTSHQKRHNSLSKESQNCPICEKSFVGLGDLKRHMKIHDSTCSICGNLFFDAAALMEHMALKHNKEINQETERHFQSHENGIGVKNDCSENLTKNSNTDGELEGSELQLKLEDTSKDSSEDCDGVYERKPVSCSQEDQLTSGNCAKDKNNKTLPAENNQNTGVQSASEDGKSCMISNDSNKFGSKKEPVQVPLVTCVICDKKLSRRSYYKHCKEVHSVQRPFQCEKCSKMFKIKYHLNQHMISHRSEKEFTCPECSKSFTRIYDMKAHLKRHLGDVSHICPICGKSFSEKKHVKRHMPIHTGENPFLCPICGETFNQSNGLKSHMSKHDPKFLLNCPNCEKQYVRKQDLDRHVLTHMGMRPFQCNLCEKSYTDRRGLRRHEICHSGERPYQCQLCGASFRQSSHLKGHMGIHAAVKPFGCPKCGRRFAEKRSLTRHKVRCIKEPTADLDLHSYQNTESKI